MSLREGLSRRGQGTGPWLRSFGNLAIGESVVGACRLAALMWVARTLGPEAFGLVGVGVALAGFLIVTQSGFDVVGTRAVAADPTRSRGHAQAIVGIRLAVATVIYAVYATVVLATTEGPERAALLMFGMSVFTTAANLRWLFVGFQRTRWVAIAVSAAALLYLLTVLVLVRSPDDLVWVPLLQVLSEAVVAGVLVAASWRRLGGWRPSFDLSRWMELLRASAPITVTHAARSVMLTVDVLLVKMLVSDAAAGHYAAPRRVTIALSIFLALYLETSLPTFVQAHARSPDAVRRMVRVAARRALYVLGPIAAVITVAAPLIVTVLVGDAYAESVAILRILIWGVALGGVVGPYFQALWALGQQHRLAVVAVGSAGVTLPLTVVLLLSAGVTGAAVADIVGKLLLLGGCALLLRRLLRTGAPASDGVVDAASPNGGGR